MDVTASSSYGTNDVTDRSDDGNDNDGNTTGYLNLNTGHEQDEHPHMRYIKAYRKREYVKAQEILNERSNHLITYKDGLLASEEKHRMVLFEEAEALC